MWNYAKANIKLIRDTANGIDWESQLIGLDPNEMSKVFTATIVKTAIRRKHRVYKKFLQRGRKQEDLVKVRDVRKET